MFVVGQFVTRCRACGSKALTPAFSLGHDGDYVFCDPEKDATGCGLVQRMTQDAPVPQDASEPISRTRRHRLRAAVIEAMEMVSTRDGVSLDIGCGDGTLMSFYPRWIKAFGMDQVQPNDEAKQWGQPVVGSFPEKDSLKKLKSYTGEQKFDVITAISVLGEQDDPQAFLSGIKEVLADDGVCVLETPYVSLALMRNNVSAFGRNVKAVYSLSNLEVQARQAGLKIVRGGMSETDGGSLRLFLTHTEYSGHDYVPWLEQLARLWDEESVLSLTSRQTYQAFSARVEQNNHTIKRFLEDMVRYEEHAHVLGADNAMVSLMEHFNLNEEHVAFVVSRDKKKYDERRYLRVGEHELEMVNEDDVRLAQPDYLIAFSGHRREALEHWREAIFDGVKLVFLTPELEIIDSHNYSTELGKALAVTDGPGSVETLKAVLSTVKRPQLVAINTAKEA